MSISQVAMGCLAVMATVYLFLKFGRGLTIVAVIAVLIVAVVGGLVLSFQSFNGRTLVASVQASAVSNVSHEMTVDLTTYSADGTPTAETYEIGGDMWFLSSETVEFQPWVLALGVHSGYHLSRLSGEYSDSELGSKPVQLGSWSWFNGIENNIELFSPVIRSAYGSAVIEPADGRSYSVYVDAQGDLSAVRA
jgi:hypothetical protein